jgi:hypothetical protein
MKSIIRFAALAFFAAAARAETTDCIDVRSVSYQISSPGVYCLKSSAAGLDARIWIGADDVVLDLNGHVLDVPVFGAAAAIGGSGVSRVTIRNGTVRGSTYGVHLTSTASVRSSGIVVERLHVERSAGCGICVQGDASVVRSNVIVGVGSATTGARAGLSVSSGTGMRVSDNLVVDMVANSGQVDGIRAVDAPGAVLERNVVSNTVLPSSSGYPMGIHLYKTSSGASTPMRTTVAGNRIVNMQTGISNQADASLFVDNAVGGATTPFSGGVMAGTSNYSF